MFPAVPGGETPGGSHVWPTPFGGTPCIVRHPVRKLLRRPLVGAFWWAAWWAWHNRPTVKQWYEFVRGAVRDRRPVGDVVREARVRVAFAMEPDLRRSGEVEVANVDGGVVSLRGVNGGSATRRAELVAARVPGVRRVTVHDKVDHVAATA